jgi:hypothetical protein
MSSKMKTGLKCLLTKKHSSLLFESINCRKSFMTKILFTKNDRRSNGMLPTNTHATQSRTLDNHPKVKDSVQPAPEET